MSKIAIFFSTLLCCFCIHVTAQAPESLNAAEIYLRLKKLNVLGSVLYVAAHPDDENTRLLAYLSKDRLYRTGYLSLTRGDGGQNLIGDEQGVELGLIRTQELLSARRIDGAEQFFTRAFDFGFSKTTAEALRIWDKEKILSDVVWVIRRFQPDVIITRFPEDSRAGHGHHSASAVLAHEAFAAAADPNRFPEQFKYGVQPWQAKRLLWNTFVFGGTNTTSEDQLKIDVGAYNPILGKSYGEIAAESRSQHKSQGFGIARTRGEAIEYFTTISGAAPRKDLMDDINIGWSRVEGAGKIGPMIDQLVKDYSFSNPEKSLPGLVALYREMLQLKDSYWKNRKLKEVQQLIEACSGLWLEATVRDPYAVQGDPMQVNFAMIDRLKSDITVKEIRLSGFDTLYSRHLDVNKNYLFAQRIQVAADHPITQPYWLQEQMSPGSFNVKDQLQIGEAQGKPAFEVQFMVSTEGQDFIFTRPVMCKYTDPVRGELYQPLTVLPPVTGRLDPDLTVFTSDKGKELEAHIKNQSVRPLQPAVSLTPVAGVQVSNEGNFHNSTYLFSAKPQKRDPYIGYASLLLDINGKKDSAKELRTISYDHIPRIDYFKDAREKFVVTDVKTEGHRIGYIEGAGDKVPEALVQMGYELVILKEKDVTPAVLKQFDAVITGIRAYEVHDWLSTKYDVLMEYIKAGGNLVVQYNKNVFQGGQRPNIGPYPFTIINARVTDENAKVSFLQPENKVLNYPNKITEKDFEGWIQERGIYFAGHTDTAYQAILSMSDPGEQEQKGSLITAQYGEGTFVYTGLVFFRELPAGVPGAYRLLANIIALNHKRGF
ncbi:MAG TPA: PIG-L family deacetylase [Puia sp.]|nr:PIG-L family deacetylase [Puia sp.]